MSRNRTEHHQKIPKTYLEQFHRRIKGLSDDGGLFICNNFNEFKFNEEFIKLNYNELSYKILKFFFNEFSNDDLNEIINSAYNPKNFKEKIVGVKSVNDNLSFLELLI